MLVVFFLTRQKTYDHIEKKTFRQIETKISKCQVRWLTAAKPPQSRGKHWTTEDIFHFANEQQPDVSMVFLLSLKPNGLVYLAPNEQYVTGDILPNQFLCG